MRFFIAFVILSFLLFKIISLIWPVLKPPGQVLQPSTEKRRRLKGLTKKSQSGNTGALEFNYVDAFDQSSQRKAKIISLERYGTHTYLNAFCFLRNEPRQFRTDRISNPVDLETGEIIDDLEAWALNQGLGMENEFL